MCKFSNGNTFPRQQEGVSLDSKLEHRVTMSIEISNVVAIKFQKDVSCPITAKKPENIRENN